MAYQFDYAAYDKVTKIGDKEITTRCGRIVNKKELAIDELAGKLIDDGFVKSLRKDELKAVLDAYYRGAKQYVYEGYIVRTGFASLRAKIKGKLGENDSIGSDTKLFVALTARDDLKLSKNECSFHNVAEQASVSIQSIATVGSTTAGTWAKNKNVIVTGSNLVFDSAIGDKVVAAFTVEGEERTVDLTVKNSQYNSMELAWHEDLFYLTAGDPVELTFTLHGGDASVTPKTITKKVTLAAA